MGQAESKTEKKREKLLAKRRTVRVLTACIMGKRRSQEDRHVALEELPDHPEISVFAIYDGHNGDSCAEFCRTSLHTNVAEKIKKGFITAPLLKQAFVETDDSFLASADREAQEAGCTAVVAIYNRVTGQLMTGNVGDARCIVSHKGKAQAMTIDHKPDVPEERKRIEAAGRKVQDSRLDGCLAVSRALGDLSLKREIDSSTGKKRTNPDQFALSPVPFVTETVVGKEHDFIVLACDGLFDVMSNQEVVDWISARLKMEKDDAEDQAAAAAAAASAVAAPPNPGPMSAQSAPAPKGAQVEDDTVVTRPASWSTDSATAHALTDEQLGTSTAGPGDTEDAPVHHRPAARGFTEIDDDDGGDDEDDGLDPREKFEKEKKRMEAKHRKRKEQQRLRMRMQTLSNRPNQYVEEEDDDDEEDKKPSAPKKKSSVINTNNMALDLAEYAVKRGSMDNISIIIVALGPKRSSSQSRLQVAPGAPGPDSTPGSPRSKSSEHDPASAPA